MVGAELSELAVKQLFAELGLVPNIIAGDKVSRYQGEHIEIFVGDIFNLSRSDLGSIDAVYDRAALVALPKPIRDRYARHLIEITACAPQLLICFNYDQSRVDGPPFSIDQHEVARQYQHTYDLTLLESKEFKGGLRGKCPANEDVWLLQKLAASS